MVVARYGAKDASSCYLSLSISLLRDFYGVRGNKGSGYTPCYSVPPLLSLSLVRTIVVRPS